MSDLCSFTSLDVLLKKAGIMLCGECMRTHSFSNNYKHANDLGILSPTSGNDAILSILFPLTSIYVSRAADGAPLSGSTSGCFSPSFDVELLEHVILKPFWMLKNILLRRSLGVPRVFFHALDIVLPYPSDLSAWVQLLILPCCVFGNSLPKTRSE